MLKITTAHCQPFIEGRAISEEEFLRWEVARSREALALLRKKLGIAGIQELLEEELGNSDREHARMSHESKGNWAASTTEIDVKGVSAGDFLQWFRERVQANDQSAMGRACPEHYVVAPTDDGRLDVIETTGGWGFPTRFFAKLGETAETACPNPDDIDSSYPMKWAGRFTLRNGEENGRVLHQFMDTAGGFKAKLTIYFPAASPPGLIEGHRWHLAVEFTNWVTLCIESRGQRR
jgi:hypothetical protein